MKLSVYLETYNGKEWSLNKSYIIEIANKKVHIPYLFCGKGDVPDNFFYKNEEWEIISKIMPIFKEEIVPSDCFMHGSFHDVFEYFDNEKFVLIPDDKAVCINIDDLSKVKWDGKIELVLKKEGLKPIHESVSLKEIFLNFYHLCKKIQEDFIFFDSKNVRLIIFS